MRKKLLSLGLSTLLLGGIVTPAHATEQIDKTVAVTSCEAHSSFLDTLRKLYEHLSDVFAINSKEAKLRTFEYYINEIHNLLSKNYDEVEKIVACKDNQFLTVIKNSSTDSLKNGLKDYLTQEELDSLDREELERMYIFSYFTRKVVVDDQSLEYFGLQTAASFAEEYADELPKIYILKTPINISTLFTGLVNLAVLVHTNEVGEAVGETEAEAINYGIEEIGKNAQETFHDSPNNFEGSYSSEATLDENDNTSNNSINNEITNNVVEKKPLSFTWSEIEGASRYRINIYLYNEEKDLYELQELTINSTDKTQFVYQNALANKTYKVEIIPRIGYMYQKDKAIEIVLKNS